MTTQTIDGIATTYGYDSAGQLASESRSGYSASYTYDGNGNRLTKTLNGTTENYSYDDGDKLLDIKVSGVALKTFSYDAAGRTTQIATSAYTRNFSYDYEGRISQITGLPTTNTFTYNGFDTRTKKVDSAGTANFKRLGAGVTAPVVDDGSATYTPGISERRSGTTTYLHAGLKTLDQRTNSSQANTGTKRYDAFGNVVSSTGSWASPWGYAGKFGYQSGDDAEIMLLGHRYYDASTGRFLSRDPAKHGRNWYGYCGNHPLGWVDPSGLRFFLGIKVNMSMIFGIDGEFGLQFNDDGSLSGRGSVQVSFGPQVGIHAGPTGVFEPNGGPPRPFTRPLAPGDKTSATLGPVELGFDKSGEVSYGVSPGASIGFAMDLFGMEWESAPSASPTRNVGSDDWTDLIPTERNILQGYPGAREVLPWL